ncbi:hypothetical protein [Streptomyces sp. DH8]|uniref:hypothetical protein n=1 Tax=Streptomyces sp. DH8 TaxID=2857008 RepID=UPI0027D3100E|nr:hypothetical protein [Streptomyces sp. DH8]
MGQLTVVNFVSLDGVMQSVLSADEDRDGGFDQGGWVLPYVDATVERFMSDATTGAGACSWGAGRTRSSPPPGPTPTGATRRWPR